MTRKKVEIRDALRKAVKPPIAIQVASDAAANNFTAPAACL
jgi:hypothetical protein